MSIRNQIRQWKDQLLAGVQSVFDDGAKATRGPAFNVKTLHAKIGQLTLQKEFLEGALSKIDQLPGAKR